MRTALPTLKCMPLHPTFAAEASGIDFSLPVPPEVVDEVKAAMAKYGVLVFRKTCLTDETHVAFSRMFGELDDVTPYTQLGRKHRCVYDELFDVSNMDEFGEIVKPDSTRYLMGLGNSLFHCDSAFNPRRAGYSLLLAHEVPPPGMGGNTEFADTRQAYADLPQETKDKLVGLVTKNSLWHSRKKAAPYAEILKNIRPEDYPFSRHYLVQTHEPSGRTNLYIAAHAHSIDGLPLASGQALIDELLSHASQPQYVTSVEWHDPGDLVIWDNTCVMHRAVSGGAYEGKFRRDMRRTTVHDGSSYNWGLNEVGATWRAGLP